MSVHFPVEHLMGPAMFGFADHLSLQGAGDFGRLGAAGLAEDRQ
jgi:hypothetical protein